MLKYAIFLIFLQAIIRKAKEIGLCSKFNNKEKNPESHGIFKKVISLALLPAEQIEQGLSHIEELAYKLGEKQDREAMEEREKKGKKHPGNFSVMWRRFFKYFKDEWMKKVKPQFFSLFDAPVRTNNLLERWHRHLNDQMGGKPGVQHFISESSLISRYLISHFCFVGLTFRIISFSQILSFLQ